MTCSIGRPLAAASPCAVAELRSYVSHSPGMSYSARLEAILKRAASTDPIVAKAIRDAAVEERGVKPLTNTPEHDLRRAPEVSKAIATALDNTQGAKSVPNLFAEAHAEVRKETIAGKNAAARSLDREIHAGAGNVAKRAEVGSKIRRDIRRDYK